MAQEMDDLQEGEMVELPEEVSDVEDTEDGGAIIKLSEDEEVRKNEEHFANIVDEVDQSLLEEVVQDLLQKIEKDKDARKKRDEQYEEGIRRTGLGDDAPGGAQFTGANKVVHPLLTEVCVDFSARAIKELFPPNGPVRSKILGSVDSQKLRKARRKTEYMNWQLTEQMVEFRSELEQLMTQLPLGGGQYMKLMWDSTRQRPKASFIPIDDMYLPFAASNFYSAERKTHVQYVTAAEFNKRIKTGEYRDIDLTNPGDIEFSKASKANDKIEGREEMEYNEDGLRIVFEVYTCEDLEDEGRRPYIISIDKFTGEAVSVYRNWMPDDDTHEELEWVIEFPFVPWRGAYPIGMIHMIGSLSGAATGALRALLDAAHISNIPTLLKLKGGPGGQTLNLQPTEVTEIEGGINVDDVRKIAMPVPFNPPSQVLYQLLGFLVDAGKGVVQTTFENLRSNDPNQPVGTTLALIEQGMVVFSSIHSRLHNSMARTLKVLHRINSSYLTEEIITKQLGDAIDIHPDDFDGPLDVIPVSDPNIFSEAQRFAQVQAIMQRQAQAPQMYDSRKVEELFIQLLKLPEGTSVLQPGPPEDDINPVTENVMASKAKPVAVLDHQDHLAHLKVHLAFLQSPLLGQNPTVAQPFLTFMLPHIKEHLLGYYQKSVTHGLKVASSNNLIDSTSNLHQADIIVRAQQVFEQTLGPELVQLMQQAMQQLQQMQPPPPMDPSQAAVQAQQIQSQQKTQSDQIKAQIEQQKMAMRQQELQLNAQLEQQKMAMNQQEFQQSVQEKIAKMQGDLMEKQRREQMELQAQIQKVRQEDADRDMEMMLEMTRQEREDARTHAEIMARLEMNRQDNETAKQLSAAEIISGDKVPYSTGTGSNPNPNP